MSGTAESATNTREDRKDLALEAVRGLAALVVVLWHFVELFSARDGDRGWLAGALRSLRAGPAQFVIDGQLAVIIFFVLSGYVLSHGFRQGRNATYAGRCAIRRLPRLAIPATASILISHAMLVTGLYFHAAVIDQVDYLDHTRMLADYDFTPSLRRVMRDATLVFVTSSEANGYNRALWTMHVELTGSLVVFTLHAFFGVGRALRLALLALCVWYLRFSSWFMLDFCVGMWLVQWRLQAEHTVSLCHRLRPWVQRLSAPAALIALLALPTWLADSPFFSHLGRLIPAALVVLAALEAPSVRKLLSGAALAQLGRISFSIYLLHLSAIFSVGMWVFGWAHRHGASYPVAFGSALLATLVTVAVAGLVFARYVDDLGIQLSRKIADVMLREPSPRAAEDSPIVTAIDGTRTER